MLFDESYLLNGEDYHLNNNIVIHQPTLEEILDYGESKYFGLVQSLTVSPADLKWQLYDYWNIEFDKVDDFEVFCRVCLNSNLKVEDTKILFGDLDFSSLKAGYTNENILVLYNENDKKLIFDEAIYVVFVEYLRQMNGLQKNEEKAGNDETRKFMIDMARDDYEINLRNNKGFKSILFPYISFYCAEMKSSFKDALNLKIFFFFEIVNQILRDKKVDHLIGGIYFGTVDQKKINKKDLNYFKDINN